MLYDGLVYLSIPGLYFVIFVTIIAVYCLLFTVHAVHALISYCLFSYYSSLFVPKNCQLLLYYIVIIDKQSVEDGFAAREAKHHLHQTMAANSHPEGEGGRLLAKGSKIFQYHLLLHKLTRTQTVRCMFKGCNRSPA